MCWPSANAGGFARWAQGCFRVGLCFASARLLHRPALAFRQAERRFCPLASFGAILMGLGRFALFFLGVFLEMGKEGLSKGSVGLTEPF